MTMIDLSQGLAIESNAGGPLYARLAAGIREAVQAGRFLPGDRLPPVREAGRQLGVNLNTVQRAYHLLAQEAVLVSRKGSGTTVAFPAPRQNDGATAALSGGLSARNQLVGTIGAIERVGLMAEVVIRLPGGQEIVCAITSSSVERLGLAVGQTAVAIIKSTDVMVARSSPQ